MLLFCEWLVSSLFGTSGVVASIWSKFIVSIQRRNAYPGLQLSIKYLVLTPKYEGASGDKHTRTPRNVKSFKSI